MSPRKTFIRQQLEQELEQAKQPRQPQHPAIMSPEELEEETRGWNRHRYQQSAPPGAISRSRDFPKKPSR
jgi:hypothetical protein